MQHKDKNKRPTCSEPEWANIPDGLKEISNWVLWRYDWSEERQAWTKVPYITENGPRRASITEDRALFLDIESVRKSFDNLFDYLFSGVGFVFTASTGLVGIDLDECVKWEGDKPIFDKWALATIKKVGMNSYIEYSPSRTGLHIIVKGKIEKAIKYDKGGIEIYAQDRYFTITGDVYNGDEPSEEQSGLDEIIEKIEELRRNSNGSDNAGKYSQAGSSESELAKGNGSGNSVRTSSKTASERIALAYNAKNGEEIKTLFESQADDLCGYLDRSVADMALCRKLCYYCEGDAEMLVAMMTLSARQRDKWFREIKSTNETYLAYTVRNCLETETSFYEFPVELSLARSAPADYATAKPRRYNLTDLKDAAIAYKYRSDILGLDCGWQNLDTIYRPRPGLLSVWIGEPGSGKSTFIFAYLYQFCLRQGLRAGLAAFEVKPLERLLHDLVRVHLHAPTFLQMDGCVSDDEFSKAIDEIDPYFCLLAPRSGERNVQELLEIIDEEQKDRSLGVWYLDPFTQLQNKSTLQMKSLDFISNQLQTMLEGTERRNLISHLIVHPVKGINRAIGLRFGDASGSGDFERVADYGLVVTAEYVGTERRTVIHAQKIRDPFTGVADGKAAFTLDQPSYLFSSAQVPIRLGKGSESGEKGEIPF